MLKGTPEFFNIIYPIGSIYMSVNSTNPHDLFGGTWQQISKGRALVGQGVVEANNDDWCGHTSAGDWTAYNGGMGGETYHKLTIAEMPSHAHNQIRTNVTSSVTDGYGMSGNYSQVSRPRGVEYTGGDGNHNNMMPYFVCYIWKRTA